MHIPTGRIALIPLSHLSGSSRGSLRSYNRRELQEIANIKVKSKVKLFYSAPES